MKAKNQENLEKLIQRMNRVQWLEIYHTPCSLKYFNQHAMFFSCGSPADVEGHCVQMRHPRWDTDRLLAYEREVKGAEAPSEYKDIREYLGVTKAVARKIAECRRQDAIDYLVTLRETK